MWNQIGVLSEDEVYNDTFSVNTLVRIDNSDPILVSFTELLIYEFEFDFFSYYH